MRFPVETMCQILKVSKSGYYHWLQTGPSKLWLENQKVTELIKSIFKDSFESYGSPRIKTELETLGYKISKPRVARIMSANYLFAKRKRKFKATTDSKHNYPICLLYTSPSPRDRG